MDYKQKYLKYKQKYLRLFKDQKGGQPFLMDILAGLAFSWLFERNQRLLQLFYTGRQPVMMQPFRHFTLNHKYRLNLLGISSLSIALATRLMERSQINRLQLAKRIMSRTHKLPEISLPTTAAQLADHHRPVTSIAFHPTAPLLATGSDDNTVKLWRLSSDNSSATCVATLKGHMDYVSSVAFHPRAPLLATGSKDTTVKLWQLSPDNLSATCMATLDRSNGGHSNSVRSVAFHPTAPLLATGSWDNTAKLWRLFPDNSSATCVATLAGHSDVVWSVVFHPTEPLLATSSSDNTVRLWQLSSDNSSADCVATLNGHSRYVSSVAFHPTMHLLATGSGDNTVKLWHLVTTPDNSSATCVATLDQSNGGHSQAVRSVAFHPTAPLLATGSNDQTVKLWRLVTTPDNSSADCVATLNRRNGDVSSVAFHPTAPLLTTGNYYNAILWKL
jgi:WD40 repeat protein